MTKETKKSFQTLLKIKRHQQWQGVAMLLFGILVLMLSGLFLYLTSLDDVRRGTEFLLLSLISGTSLVVGIATIISSLFFITIRGATPKALERWIAGIYAYGIALVLLIPMILMLCYIFFTNL